MRQEEIVAMKNARFNFARSFVLGSLRTDGDFVLIERAFHPGTIRIPRSGVKCIVIKELDDSSVRVVDYEKPAPGESPSEVIVAAGHASQLPAL